MNKILGILGGMGPLASAEFLKTLYEFNVADIEQEMPACFLYSDPKIPDRTEAIVTGSDEVLINCFIEALERLYFLGVNKIVIPCITIHHFLPRVPLILREKVISLVDLILEEVLKSKERHLLLCTTGTLKAGIFQQHSLWSLAEQYIIIPHEEQNKIHHFIYQIKKEAIKESAIPFIDTLLKKYEVNSFIAGCTEIHLLTKYLIQHDDQNYRVVDPLLIMAKELLRLIDSQPKNAGFTTNHRGGDRLKVAPLVL
jgi:aspartate racemase